MAKEALEWAMEVTGITSTQKLVLCALAHHMNWETGKCFPSQKTIAKTTGLSLSGIKLALQRLQDEGLISRTKTVKGGWDSNDEYTLHQSAESGATRKPRHDVAPPRRDPDRSHDVTTSKNLSGSNQPTNKTGGAATRGTRIPDPFIVNTDMRQWAANECPAVDVDHATRMFVDHFRAATGRNATKLDWPATWRNWLRRDQQTAAKRPQRLNDHERVATAAQIGARLAARPQELTA